jgi:diguanylate cyclase
VNTQDHPIGDQVLRLVAKVVKDKVREGDLLARYGGEELLTCPGLTLGPAKRS